MINEVDFNLVKSWSLFYILYTHIFFPYIFVYKLKVQTLPLTATGTLNCVKNICINYMMKDTKPIPHNCSCAGSIVCMRPEY